MRCCLTSQCSEKNPSRLFDSPKAARHPVILLLIVRGAAVAVGVGRLAASGSVAARDVAAAVPLLPAAVLDLVQRVGDVSRPPARYHHLSASATCGTRNMLFTDKFDILPSCSCPRSTSLTLR